MPQQARTQAFALPVLTHRYRTFAAQAARYAGVTAGANLLQATVDVRQRDVGHALVIVDRHPLRVQAGQAATEPGDEAQAPRLVGDRAEKTLVPVVILLAQRADQHGRTVIKLFDPVLAGVRLFSLLRVHGASRYPDRCLKPL